MMMGGYIGKLRSAEPPLVCGYYDLNGSRKNALTTDGQKMLKANGHLLEQSK